MQAILPKFRYLSAWFCPYAHRATLALEHHAGAIEYEWVEALGWEQRKDEKNVTGTGKEWWYHWKVRLSILLRRLSIQRVLYPF